MEPHDLAAAIAERPFAILTGAGCSTESGIPDYRGQGAPRPLKAPMRWQSFRDDPEARRRYWARAFVGWTRFQGAEPNPAHEALAQLEARGRLAGLVTQNVDGLHEAAGSQAPVKLHGSLAWVRCVDCTERLPRVQMQEELARLNPEFQARAGVARPDGDVDLDEARVAAFEVYACPHCGGRLKPDVVFFGESIPSEVKARARAIVESAQDLLVVGSSLAVGSAGLLVRRSQRLWILNIGPTRFDGRAHALASARAGEFLPRVVAHLDGG